MASTSGVASRKRINRILVTGFSGIVLLALALSVLQFATMRYLADREADLRTNVYPRIVLNERVHSGMIDQETAVRGYVITADDRFLQAYDSGRERYLAAREELSAMPPLTPAVAALRAETFALADAWHDAVAAPVIAAVREGGPAAVDPAATSRQSKDAIDAFRDASERYDAALQLRVDDETQTVQSARRLVTWATGIASALLICLTAVVSFWLLRNVSGPLDTLAREVSAIDAGDVDRRVPALDVVEFDRLGASINRMLDSLAASRREITTQQQRLATIVESANEGIVVVDANGRVGAINSAGARMFQVDPDDADGMQAADLGFVTARDLRDDLATGTPIVRRRGNQVLSAIVSPLQSNGQPRDDGESGWVWVVRDVTELARIDEMKNEFISIVSHELRTPLTAIKGFTDLLLEGEAGALSDGQQEFLQIVQANSDRLVALINDMLDISRIEAGRITLALDDVSISGAVDQAISALRPLIDDKDIHVQTEIPDDLPPAVADEGRLQQILTNLISNACKYSATDGWIAIRVERLDSQVAVSVSDTGIGIPPEALPNVFSKFYRVDSAATRRVGGTGLGLAITKSLVEMHGGRITIASRPGVGTTVRFTLPLERANAAEPAPAQRRGPLVLLATSDTDERERWARLVTAIPAVPRATRAASLPAIVAETEQHRPSIVVARLSDADGLHDLDDLLADLREYADGEPPCLVAVGRAGSGDLEQDEARIVRLPASANDEAVIGAVRALLPLATHETPRRGTVLVADDDADNAALLRRGLTSFGFDVVTVNDGLAAVVRAIELLPDAIVLDASMPKMGAAEVLPQLRGNPGTRDVPIVVLSGTVPDAGPVFLAAGANDFFVKPVNADVIARRLIELRRG